MTKLLAWIRSINWKRTAGFTALFIVVFVVSLYLTFPYDAVTNAIVKKVESKGNIQLEIEEIKPFRLTGVRVKGLKITSRTDRRSVFLEVDEVRARLRFSQLLLRRLWVDFDVYAYDGGIAGSFCKRGPAKELAVNVAGIHLAKYGTRNAIRNVGQMDLDGVISGQFEAHLSRVARRGNSGFIDLNIDNLKLLNMKMVSTDLPDMVFEPVHLAANLKNQNFQLEEFKAKSNHMDLQLSGRVNIADSLQRIRLFLNLRFKPSDEFEEALGMLMLTMKEPDSEGYYKLSINGTPGNMNVRR